MNNTETKYGKNVKLFAFAGIAVIVIAGIGFALLSNKDNSNNIVNPASNNTQKEYTTIRMPNETIWVT